MRELAVLGRIEWLGPAVPSKRFATAGAAYGFIGRGAAAPQAHHCRQVHGTRLVVAAAGLTDPAATARIEADALVTRVAGETIAVRTADCLPVLLADRRRTLAACAHAGWRGLTAGILGSVVAGLAGCEPAELSAVIGPAISRERFQVGPEVAAAVADGPLGLTTAQAGLCLAKGLGDRWHVDLAVAAVWALVNAGLDPERIAVVQECTWAGDARWYSYRREGAGCGSNWSWIKL